MKQAILLTITVLGVCFGSAQQAHAGTQVYSCGQTSEVQAAFHVDWRSRTGTAAVQGDLVADWLESAGDQVNLSCQRQGGSSMRPWWTCEAAVEGKQMEVVFVDVVEPATARILLRGAQGEEVLRHLDCAENS